MILKSRRAIVLASVLLGACGQGAGDTSSGTPTEAAAGTTADAGAAPAGADTSQGATESTPLAASASSPAAVAAVASAEAPPAAFAICSSCHSPEAGRNGIGPSLAGVVGRKAGSLPDYAYSDALKNSGIVWDRAKLDTWLQGPMKMVPGTKMVIAIGDPAGRKAVLDYLETLK